MHQSGSNPLQSDGEKNRESYLQTAGWIQMMKVQGKIMVPLLLLAIIFSFMPYTECVQNDNLTTTFPASPASYSYVKSDKNFIDKNPSINAKVSNKAKTTISDSQGNIEYYDDFITKNIT